MNFERHQNPLDALRIGRVAEREIDKMKKELNRIIDRNWFGLGGGITHKTRPEIKEFIVADIPSVKTTIRGKDVTIRYIGPDQYLISERTSGTQKDIQSKICKDLRQVRDNLKVWL